MRDATLVTIFVVGLPLIGWILVHGLQTGMMEAAGVPFARYSRSKNPIMFWLATIFNALVLVGGVALLVSELF